MLLHYPAHTGATVYTCRCFPKLSADAAGVPDERVIIAQLVPKGFFTETPETALSIDIPPTGDQWGMALSDGRTPEILRGT